MAIVIRTTQTTWKGPLASEPCAVSRLFAGAAITVDVALEPGS